VTDPRRAIPGLDRLLGSEAVAPLLEEWPRERVADALRGALDEARRGVPEGDADPGDLDDPARYAAAAELRLRRADRPSLRRVVNATGVVLHTNLGRAPLADEARAAMARAGGGYSNLELDLEDGRRGSRYVHCVALLRELIRAEDALVVNNNAAALVLALNTVARGAPVIVSRGELVEIGGGFRIPDMLERAGTRLVEVGTTNRTRPDDYRRALSGRGTGAILKVHRSNFRMTGFTEEASLESLSEVASEAGVPLIHDLGSGLLVDAEGLGLPPEPTPAGSLAAGSDVVCFSGDKLLGGPQAGLLAGGVRWIAPMRSNPLCRALRVDKVTLAGLEATLALYRDPAAAVRRIPALAALTAEPERLRERAEALSVAVGESGWVARVEPTVGRVGGGTYPGFELPSWALLLDPGPGGSAASLAAGLRAADPPVVPRVEEGCVVIDVRTVLEGEEEDLLRALEAAVGARNGGGSGAGADASGKGRDGV
jgi:L-seryl-tRNA(Ser) seleniumtransferase